VCGPRVLARDLHLASFEAVCSAQVATQLFSIVFQAAALQTALLWSKCLRVMARYEALDSTEKVCEIN
jgi:hypothetical protein